MTRTMLLGVALALAACSGQQMQDSMRSGFGKVFKPRHNIERFESQCADVAFSARGSCIREKMTAGYPAWRSDPNADLNDVYLSWMEAAGARVAAGKMDETEARLGAAEIKLRMQQITAQRANTASIQRQTGVAQMLTGLAIMNSANPQPGPQITCRSVPTGLGTTTTTCN